MNSKQLNCSYEIREGMWACHSVTGKNKYFLFSSQIGHYDDFLFMVANNVKFGKNRQSTHQILNTSTKKFLMCLVHCLDLTIWNIG